VSYVSPDSGFLEGAVHPFDLAVGPRMVRLGEPVLDAMLAADTVEHACGWLHITKPRARKWDGGSLAILC